MLRETSMVRVRKEASLHVVCQALGKDGQRPKTQTAISTLTAWVVHFCGRWEGERTM